MTAWRLSIEKIDEYTQMLQDCANRLDVLNHSERNFVDGWQWMPTEYFASHFKIKEIAELNDIWEKATSAKSARIK